MQITLHVTECGKDEDGNAYCEETSKACLTSLWGTKPNGKSPSSAKCCRCKLQLSAFLDGLDMFDPGPAHPNPNISHIPTPRCVSRAGKEDYTNFCPAGFWDRESMGDFDCDSWTIPDIDPYLDNFKTATYMPGCSDNFYSLVDQNGDPLEAYEQRAYSCTVEGPFMRWRYMLSGADAQATVTGLTNTLMCKPSPHKRFVFHLADTPSLSAGPDTVWEACPGVDWPGPWDAAATGAPSWLLLLTASAMLVLYSGV